MLLHLSISGYIGSIQLFLFLDSLCLASLIPYSRKDIIFIPDKSDTDFYHLKAVVHLKHMFPPNIMQIHLKSNCNEIYMIGVEETRKCPAMTETETGKGDVAGYAGRHGKGM